MGPQGPPCGGPSALWPLGQVTVLYRPQILHLLRGQRRRPGPERRGLTGAASEGLADGPLSRGGETGFLATPKQTTFSFTSSG